jgi:hypothetical protein
MAMKVLRNTKTLEYFAYGEWTPDVSLAQGFADIRSVNAVCVKYRLKDVELVTQLDLEHSEPEVADMPLSSR